jgi:hypothetical protein
MCPPGDAAATLEDIGRSQGEKTVEQLGHKPKS